MAGNQEKLEYRVPALREEFVQIQARLHVYSAVLYGRDTQTALLYYQQHEAILVPSSVDRWAERTNQDIKTARSREAKVIFQKDEEAAKNMLKNGLLIKGKTVTLADLVLSECVKMMHIKTKLGK